MGKERALVPKQLTEYCFGISAPALGFKSKVYCLWLTLFIELPDDEGSKNESEDGLPWKMKAE